MYVYSWVGDYFLQISYKFMTYEKIDEYIKKTDLDNITEIEKFILEVYNKSKQKEEGLHENTLYRDKYIEIKHI